MSSAAGTPHNEPPSRRPRRPPGRRGYRGLTGEALAASQRERLIEAMAELAGTEGYVPTTVADVLLEAEVSRKAFYKHFPDKRACFLAAYDELIARGRRDAAQAYSSAETPSERAGAAISALLARGIEHPAHLRVVLVEIAALGAPGIERRERLVSEFEGLVRELLGLPKATGPIPNPVLRAIVGGLIGVASSRLRGGREGQLRELIPDIVRWASSYHPAPEAIKTLLARPPVYRPPEWFIGGRAPGTLVAGMGPVVEGQRRRGLGPGTRGVSRSLMIHNQRERILDAVAQLVSEDGFAALTVERIAGRAAISLQAFYEHYDSKDDAFLVAYELGHAKALGIVRRAAASEGQFALNVRAGLAALLDFLASEPAFAHLALVDAQTATSQTSTRTSERASTYGQLLLPGAEGAANLMLPPPVAIEAIAGGVAELCVTYAMLGYIPRLPELLPRATYFALAPFIGLEAAAQVATAPPNGLAGTVKTVDGHAATGAIDDLPSAESPAGEP